MSANVNVKRKRKKRTIAKVVVAAVVVPAVMAASPAVMDASLASRVAAASPDAPRVDAVVVMAASPARLAVVITK